MSDKEFIHLKPAREGAVCDAHDWPTLGLPKRFVEEMRARHGRGGRNACRACVDRAKAEADRERQQDVP